MFNAQHTMFNAQGKPLDFLRNMLTVLVNGASLKFKV